MAANTLYYGDNLDILRRYVADESVDLVYLDPPFNSNASYNVLFAEQDGTQAASQIHAFEDTWRWDQGAEHAYQEVVETGGDVSRALQAFRTLLGESNMMAYLAMMAPRLCELRRVLKPTGSIYLHCDPTASHYLKLLMDAIYGPRFFVNEIVWKRSDAHSDARQGAQHFGRIHDVLLFYSKGDTHKFTTLFTPLPQSTVDNWYRNVEPETGRRFNKADVTGPDGTPRALALADPARGEREVALELLARCKRESRTVLICDKGYAGREFAAAAGELRVLVVRPRRADEPGEGPHLSQIRQRIESIFWTCKDLLTLERHGARTLAGLRERVLQRFLCLAACINLNHRLGRPSRSLVSYCA